MSENEIIDVTINGQKRQVPDGMTVEGLLEFLNVKKITAVVEHNKTVLGKDEHSTATVKDGDTLEIVRFVGGG